MFFLIPFYLATCSMRVVPVNGIFTIETIINMSAQFVSHVSYNIEYFCEVRYAPHLNGLVITQVVIFGDPQTFQHKKQQPSRVLTTASPTAS